MIKTNVIKRSKNRAPELFDIKKLQDSITASCLSVRCRPGEARSVTSNVCKGVCSWIKDKPEITSKDLRIKTAAILERYQPDASYVYKHQNFTL